MKKAILKFFCITAAAVFTISLSGCAFTNEFIKAFNEGYNRAQQKNVRGLKAIKSKDGSVKLDVPDGWVEDNKLTSEALIKVTNRLEGKYLIVMCESAAHFTNEFNPEDYANLVKKSMCGAVNNSSATDFSNLTINGLPASYFEIRGEIEDLKIVYQIAIIKGKDNFYQVIGWTSDSLYENNKDEINSVIKSFKELRLSNL